MCSLSNIDCYSAYPRCSLVNVEHFGVFDMTCCTSISSAPHLHISTTLLGMAANWNGYTRATSPAAARCLRGLCCQAAMPWVAPS